MVLFLSQTDVIRRLIQSWIRTMLRTAGFGRRSITFREFATIRLRVLNSEAYGLEIVHKISNPRALFTTDVLLRSFLVKLLAAGDAESFSTAYQNSR